MLFWAPVVDLVANKVMSMAVVLVEFAVNRMMVTMFWFCWLL